MANIHAPIRQGCRKSVSDLVGIHLAQAGTCSNFVEEYANSAGVERSGIMRVLSWNLHQRLEAPPRLRFGANLRGRPKVLTSAYTLDLAVFRLIFSPVPPPGSLFAPFGRDEDNRALLREHTVALEEEAALLAVQVPLECAGGGAAKDTRALRS